MTEIPHDARITLQVKPEANSASFGLGMRGSGNYGKNYELRISPYERKVELHHQPIVNVHGLDRPFTLDIVLKGDIIDVCIDNRRCLVNRCPELCGDRLFLFCQDGDVVFDSVGVCSLSLHGDSIL